MSLTRGETDASRGNRFIVFTLFSEFFFKYAFML